MEADGWYNTKQINFYSPLPQSMIFLGLHSFFNLNILKYSAPTDVGLVFDRQNMIFLGLHNFLKLNILKYSVPADVG